MVNNHFKQVLNILNQQENGKIKLILEFSAQLEWP